MDVLFPEIYPILDVGVLEKLELDLETVAVSLAGSGIRLVQYRNKSGSPHEILNGLRLLQRIFDPGQTTVMLNDRVDLARLAGCGVHVGQTDLAPGAARGILGPAAMIGVSTHSPAQVALADGQPVDYIAIGPIFATSTKLDAEPVVGLDGLRLARSLTSKPLVAIGGITRDNARSVREAGADSLAVISGLLLPGEDPGEVARDFLRALR